MSVENDLLIKRDTATSTTTAVKSISDITQVANEQLAKFDTAYRAPDLSKLLVTEKNIEETIGQPMFELDLDENKVEEQSKADVVKKSRAITLTLKAKLIISVAAITMILLSVLLIYNATLISSYKGDIAYNTEVLQVEQARLNGLMEELESISSQTASDLGLGETTSTIKLPNVSKLQKTTYTEESNWFDAVCEFFSSIFGG